MMSILEKFKCQPPQTSQQKPNIFYHPFQLPITYLQKEYIHSLSPTVATDLELEISSANQKQNKKTMYQYLLLEKDNKNSLALEMAKEHAKYFTTHVPFLTDTQKIIQNLPLSTNFITKSSNEGFMVKKDTEQEQEQEIQPIWEEITLKPDFKEKFNYIEFQYFEQFNKSSFFLECLSLIHLSSPIFSLLFFIIFLIAPIALITIAKSPLTIQSYFIHLSSFSKVSFLGKMAKTICSFGMTHYQSIIMIFCCIVFYGIQFYNGYVSYQRFWRNIKLINTHLISIREFTQSSIVHIQNFLLCVKTSGALTYQQFCSETQRHLQTLEQIQLWLKPIQPFQTSVHKLREFGDLLQCYYELYCNRDFDLAIRYAVGFSGYENHLMNLQRNLLSGRLSCASFADSDLVFPKFKKIKNAKSEPETKKETETQNQNENPDNQLFEMYYPANNPDESVRNNCDLTKNMIITGPNASGKTTFLKTTALNLIFTQQFGMGCYSHAVIYRPYTHFHTYLNIPDSSDRDSLFQAEARRGKEILDAITVSDLVSDRESVSESVLDSVENQETIETSKVNTEIVSNKYQNAFLLMDELFSGTNHDDAVRAGYGFLCYLGKQERQTNARFMLTTHFVEICDTIEKNVPYVADNYQMMVEFSDHKIDTEQEKEKEQEQEQEMKYLYQIQKGTSKIRCGVHILKQMNYPKEVLSYVHEIDHFKEKDSDILDTEISV